MPWHMSIAREEVRESGPKGGDAPALDRHILPESRCASDAASHSNGTTYPGTVAVLVEELDAGQLERPFRHR
jgi:hypothetical protein